MDNKLEQLLKIADLVSSGGEAKSFLLTKDVYINGEKDNRRGRKLYKNDELIRKIRQLEIEEFSLKKEKDEKTKERLKTLKEELASFKSKKDELYNKWLNEKKELEESKNAKEELEKAKLAFSIEKIKIRNEKISYNERKNKMEEINEGMKVCGITCVTNMAAGVLPEKLSHEDVNNTAEKVKMIFKEIIKEFITVI